MMRRSSIIAAALLFSISSSKASTSDAYTNGSVFSYKVDPSRPDKDPIAMDDLAPKPFIAVSAVLPPSKMCMQDKCWPAVMYFANNPDVKKSLKITVSCSAFTREGNLLATADSWIGLDPDHAGSSVIVLNGADYNNFGRVDCRIIRFEPL